MRRFHYSDWQDIQSLARMGSFSGLALKPSSGHPVDDLCTVDPIDPKSLTRKSAP
jgi:hypothetical protein